MRDTLGCDKFVYFMRRSDNGWVKIGISNNPFKRREQLAGELKTEIKLFNFCLIPDRKIKRAYDLEQMLHKHFAAYRMDGEWFKLKNLPMKAVEYSVLKELGYLVPYRIRLHKPDDKGCYTDITMQASDIAYMYLSAKNINIGLLSVQHKHSKNGVKYRMKPTMEIFKQIGQEVYTAYKWYYEKLDAFEPNASIQILFENMNDTVYSNI